MLESNKARVLGAVSVTLIIGVVHPAFFGGTTDPWGKFIHDYQTLIAGLAAVAAAAWTISVMEKTESGQDERHRQLLKAERLMIDRAVNPQLKDAAAVFAAIESLRAILQDQSDENVARFIDDPNLHHSDFERITRFVAPPLSGAAKHLFSSDMNEVFETLSGLKLGGTLQQTIHYEIKKVTQPKDLMGGRLFRLKTSCVSRNGSLCASWRARTHAWRRFTKR